MLFIRHIVLLMMAAVALCSAAGPRVTVIGDSISTFEGYSIYPAYYSQASAPGGVDCVEKTYWWRVIRALGGSLEKNAAWSGTQVAGLDESAMSSDYRLDKSRLGDSDLILVCGGTNDARNPGLELGEYVYSDWTSAQREQFRPAFARLVSGLKERCPNAKIMIIINSSPVDYEGICPQSRWEAFAESMRVIANHYGVMSMTCKDIEKHTDPWTWSGGNEVRVHPNVRGMAAMAQQIIAAYAVQSLGRKIRVACVGDSITAGYLLQDPAAESYPAQMQNLLGDQYLVGNFGNPGKGVYQDLPDFFDSSKSRAWKSSESFSQALAFKPDIVVAGLGINDITHYADESTLGIGGQTVRKRGLFRRQYLEVLEAFRRQNPNVKFVLWTKLGPLGSRHEYCRSTTPFRMRADLEALAQQEDAVAIDVCSPLASLVEDPEVFQPDGIHPKKEGARILAETVAAGVRSAGCPLYAPFFSEAKEPWFDGGITNGWPTAVSMTGGSWNDATAGVWQGDSVAIVEGKSLGFTAKRPYGTAHVAVVTVCAQMNVFDTLPPVPENTVTALVAVEEDLGLVAYVLIQTDSGQAWQRLEDCPVHVDRPMRVRIVLCRERAEETKAVVSVDDYISPPFPIADVRRMRGVEFDGEGLIGMLSAARGGRDGLVLAIK